MKTITQETSYFIAFLIIALLLGGAAYLQLYMGVNPCPLCILQRVVFALLSIVFLFGMAFAFNKFGRYSIGTLAFLVSILGIVVSSRQVWLQHNPTGLSSNCDVSLQYMLQAFPLTEVIQRVYAGGSTCAQVDWQFFHLSLAEWSLMGFVVFALFSIFQLVRK